MDTELAKQIYLMQREVAALRRDWALFARVFVTTCESPARNTELGWIKDLCPQFAFQLRDLLQDSIFLRLCKLSDPGKGVLSFQFFAGRLKCEPDRSIGQDAERFGELVNEYRIRKFRTDRIAHSLQRQRADEDYELFISRTEKLVGRASDLEKRVVALIPDIAKQRVEYAGGDSCSALEFVNLLRRASQCAEVAV